MMYKKLLLPLLAVFFVCVSLPGCEEPVELALRPTEPILAVDAQLNDRDSIACTVRLSLVTDYFTPTASPPVTDATVWVTDETGLTDTLTHSPNEPGLYRSSRIRGAVGGTYTLQIRHAGKAYSATGTMQRVLPLDAVGFNFLPENIFQEAGWYVEINAQELPGRGDNVFLWHSINGERQTLREQWFYSSDEDVDGNYLRFDLFGPFETHGDTVEVIAASLEDIALEYYIAAGSLVGNAGGSPFGSPPWNAPTNLQGGAVGLFRVSALSVARGVVPES